MFKKKSKGIFIGIGIIFVVGTISILGIFLLSPDPKPLTEEQQKYVGDWKGTSGGAEINVRISSDGYLSYVREKTSASKTFGESATISGPSAKTSISGPIKSLGDGEVILAFGPFSKKYSLTYDTNLSTITFQDVLLANSLSNRNGIPSDKVLMNMLRRDFSLLSSALDNNSFEDYIPTLAISRQRNIDSTGTVFMPLFDESDRIQNSSGKSISEYLNSEFIITQDPVLDNIGLGYFVLSLIGEFIDDSPLYFKREYVYEDSNRKVFGITLEEEPISVE